MSEIPEFTVWRDEPNIFGEPMYVDSFGQHYGGLKEYDAENDENWFIPDMVEFGSVAENVFGQQSQYASRYLGKQVDYPDLAKDLRITGDPYEYHDLGIHFQDIPTLFARIQAYRAVRGESYDYIQNTKRSATPQEREWGKMLLAGKPLYLQIE